MVEKNPGSYSTRSTISFRGIEPATNINAQLGRWSCQNPLNRSGASAVCGHLLLATDTDSEAQSIMFDRDRLVLAAIGQALSRCRGTWGIHGAVLFRRGPPRGYLIFAGG
jgi:hypothetical protein